VSDKTQEIIDEKVRSLIRDSYNKARTIIADNRVLHESIVSALLEKETLSKEDFDALFEPKVAA
jgi:cell division protease FtsH